MKNYERERFTKPGQLFATFSFAFAGMQLLSILFQATPWQNTPLVVLYFSLVYGLKTPPLLLIAASLLVAPADGILIATPIPQNPDIPLHLVLVLHGLVHGLLSNGRPNLGNPNGAILALSVVFFFSHILSAESITSLGRLSSNLYSSLPVLIGVLVLAVHFVNTYSPGDLFRLHFVGTAVASTQNFIGISLATTGWHLREDSPFLWRSDSRLEWITANSLVVSQICLILLVLALLKARTLPKWYLALSVPALTIGISLSGSVSAYVAFVVFVMALLSLKILGKSKTCQLLPVIVTSSLLALWAILLDLFRPLGIKGPLSRLRPTQSAFEDAPVPQVERSALFRLDESEDLVQEILSGRYGWFLGTDVISNSDYAHHNFFLYSLGLWGLLGLVVSAIITIWWLRMGLPALLRNLPLITMLASLAAMNSFPTKPWAYFFAGLVSQVFLNPGASRKGQNEG